MSPDGQHIAYTELRWEKENDGRNTDLWVVDVSSVVPEPTGWALLLATLLAMGWRQTK